MRKIGFRILYISVMLIGMQSVLCAQNAIVTENSLPGNPSSEWDISGAGDLSIQGFATSIGVNKGNTVSFKVNSPTGVPFSAIIYRLGYYQGSGARLIANLGQFTGISQAPCITDTVTGEVDCGNWIAQFNWTPPANAVSGIYIVKLTRSDNGGSSHIIFIVRDDASTSPILFKTSDATWTAYNDYGGNNLYGGIVRGYPNGRAVKVSYNRPMINRQGVLPNRAIPGLTGLFNAEYPMVRWLERNGYDLTYTTCADIASDPRGITPTGAGGTYARKVVLSVGHDEYWAKEERTKFENARNAGVSLAFFSGNEIYWKTRWEPSIDGTATSFRTIVCYKEGFSGEAICNRKCDPLGNVWTGLWRSGCDFPGADGCKPENALSGQISWNGTWTSITVPAEYGKYRFWKNTGIAGLAAGQMATFPNGTLGHEWDPDNTQFASSYPARRITLSRTDVSGLIHKLSIYKHSSGALVFGAGTVQWSWGLDSKHDRGNLPPSQDMQQATVNLLSDMGVQASTLQSNLVIPTSSSDVTGPNVQVSSPTDGSTIPANSPITITGISTDVAGEVGGVEFSDDNGISWTPASGTRNWTTSWTTPSTGPVTIKVRAFDDSWNTGAETNITINISPSTGPTCPCNTIFGTAAPDNQSASNDGTPIVLGMRFRADIPGSVVGVRFYKTSNNAGTHTGLLYTNTGTLLSQVTFTNETASGWQQANFSSPVQIQAGATYVIAYHSGSGFYSSTIDYLSSARVNEPLSSNDNGTDGLNGVFLYSSTPAFPTNTFRSSNYWVDVAFKGGIVSIDTVPPVITNITVTPNTNATALINWSTNELSDNRVDYGTTSASLNLNSFNATQTNNHSITLTGLSPNTVYYYRVTSKDASNNSTTSPVATAAPLQFTSSPSSTSTVCTTADPCNTVLGNTAPINPTAFNDGTPISVGMRFRPDINGNIVALRFYKASNNTGTHTGMLFTNSGTLLSQVIFTNETASGWQEATLAAPVPVQAGTIYVVAYHSGSGYYSATFDYFTTAKTNAPLTAPANGSFGPNGAFVYNSSPVFPTKAFRATNYWVDVSFKGADTDPPVITNITATPNTDGTALLSWSTNELSDSRVDYGTDPTSLNLNSVNANQTSSHSLTLSGLSPNTVYYYRITSKDASNNAATSPATSSTPLQFTTPPSSTPTICATDDLASNFSAGTTGANTEVVSAVNGEVILKQSFTEEPFNGSTVPAGWTATNWNTSGSTNFTGGIATLNGSHLFTNTTFLQGSIIEFSARYSMDNFQNIGFALNGNFDYYWMAIGRGNEGVSTNLYVRTGDGGQVLLGTDLLNAYHVYKILRNSSGFTVYVDGTLKATITKNIASPLVFIASDLNTNGNALSIDYFRNISGGFPSTGTFTSRVLSIGSTTGTATVGWNATVPASTTLSIAARSGNTSTPDAGWTPFITVSNNQSISLQGSFVQYKADLTTSNAAVTPALNDISFYCTQTAAATGKMTITDNAFSSQLQAVNEGFTLGQNRPNPFNNTTAISYSVPKTVRVALTIYDLQGRIVKVIDEGQRKAGRYTVTIDSRNMRKGVYMYRLQAGEFQASKKMILE